MTKHVQPALSSATARVAVLSLSTPLVFALLAACGGGETTQTKTDTSPQTAAAAAPTAEEAKQFVTRVNQDLKGIYTDAARASWVASTYITDDTEKLAAAADEEVMAYTTRALQEATGFDGVTVDDNIRRQLNLLKLSSSLPAPDDAAKRKELATIASEMTSRYGKGKWCPEGKDDDESCLDLLELSQVLKEKEDYDELLTAWDRWRTISPPMRSQYARYVELGNQGAQQIGFDDLGHLWKSRYDMPADQFEGEVERLWNEVRPLYEDLHCAVRSKMAKRYSGKIDEAGPMPAHVFGNMWAQDWSALYPLMEPHPGHASLDVDKALVAKGYDEMKMVKTAEGFFTSIGLKELPPSFYERSMYIKPQDRDVVCHASAWDVTYEADVRIKMCIKVDEEDLITIHHELGHIYYYLYYYNLPVLYQDGAHDGFHEAIGDAIALSVNPQYLKKVGILDEAKSDEKALLNYQMKVALEKISFLPFGRMIDQWRWDVFSGKVAPDGYNQHWWKLRQKYQGLKAPNDRPTDAFDPGAKFHIPANVPYVRYFLSFILQFQMHKAMCEAAGHTGPLHTCSIYGSKEAGAKMQKLLSMGSSRPWPDALEVLTGSRSMSAKPLLEYFAPLQTYLKTQNNGRTCGWPAE